MTLCQESVIISKGWTLSGSLWQASWGITSEVACAMFPGAQPPYLGPHTPLGWLIPPISLETAGDTAGRLGWHHCSVTHSLSCPQKKKDLSQLWTVKMPPLSFCYECLWVNGKEVRVPGHRHRSGE